MADRELRPIVAESSLRQRALEVLQEAIFAGEMRPGDVLSAPSLAARLGISATPVREAMLDLERRGFVETVRNKGFRITAPSLERARQLTEIRILLEPPAVARHAGKISKDDLQRMRALALDELERTKAEDLRGRATTETAFHHELMKLTGNPILADLVVELRQQTRVPDLTPHIASGELSRSAQEHLTLLDLLERGDSEEVETVLRDHIASVLSWFPPGEPEARKES